MLTTHLGAFQPRFALRPLKPSHTPGPPTQSFLVAAAAVDAVGGSVQAGGQQVGCLLKVGARLVHRPAREGRAGGVCGSAGMCIARCLRLGHGCRSCPA